MGAPPRRTCAGKRTDGLRPWERDDDKLHTRGGVWPCCRLAHAICYAVLDRGVAELTSLSDLRLARIAAIAVLIAALGLAGCGRKGGLGPPAGSARRRYQSLAAGPRTCDRARRQGHPLATRTATAHAHRLAAQLSPRHAPFHLSQRRASRRGGQSHWSGAGRRHPLLLLLDRHAAAALCGSR